MSSHPHLYLQAGLAPGTRFEVRGNLGIESWKIRAGFIRITLQVPREPKLASQRASEEEFLLLSHGYSIWYSGYCCWLLSNYVLLMSTQKKPGFTHESLPPDTLQLRGR